MKMKMKIKTALFGLMAGLLLMSPAAFAQIPVPNVLFSTGVDNSSSQLPDAAVDSHWMITYPNGVRQTAVVVGTTGCTPPVGNTTCNNDGSPSKWIGPDSVSLFIREPRGAYRYTTTFSLGSPLNLIIKGKWNADDRVSAIRLNGVTVGPAVFTPPWPAAGWSGYVYTNFTIESGLQTGLNTLEFTVFNDNGSSNRDNPTGFRAELALVLAGAPPTATAGSDFSVDEGQTLVTLNGSGSSDPDNDPLTYAWTQLTGTTVTLSDAAAQQPTFTAPTVPLGGETLTFELTVTANGESDTDTVDITVVNANHTPVAEAGSDNSVAENSPVSLNGSASYDGDGDPITYSWVQDSGPAVTLSGADTANPTFNAPFVGVGGAPGVVATLVFKLTVDDGFPPDVAGNGPTFDSVTITITNVNNDPTAAAGNDQTSDENTPVTLSGALSSDPDSDALTYSWVQTGGISVLLNDSSTATPSFTAPFVSPGGGDLTFDLTVNDGYGGESTDTVVLHVQNANDPPLISAAKPTIGNLWPPNHKMVLIGIIGVSDPDNNATITIDAVYQDELTNGTGDGDTAVDAIINADGTVYLRAERSGNGNGRVYYIHFTASDLEGSVSGIVMVTVRHNLRTPAIADGELYDSTQ